MKNYKIVFAAVLILGFVATATTAQSNAKSNSCFQNAEEKLALIREAENNQYNVRRVEISGNDTTRHRVFVEKMFINEGDIFTLSNLMKSISGVSKIKKIKPIKLEDVEIRLDKNYRIVDFVFCVEEKKKD